MISRQGYAETAVKMILLLLGASWGHVGPFFAFFRIFGASRTILAFFIDFFRFFIDLGRILGGFWEDFGKIFRRLFGFFLPSIFRWIFQAVCSPCRLRPWIGKTSPNPDFVRPVEVFQGFVRYADCVTNSVFPREDQ